MSIALDGIVDVGVDHVDFASEVLPLVLLFSLGISQLLRFMAHPLVAEIIEGELRCRCGHGSLRRWLSMGRVGINVVAVVEVGILRVCHL